MTVVIDQKEIESEVIKKLKRYPLLKVKVENIREQEEKGLNPFKSYRDRNKFAEDELSLKQIERSLNILDSTQFKIIEMKYINNPDKVNDTDIYTELLLKKGIYYGIRKEAINKIAEALGMI